MIYTVNTPTGGVRPACVVNDRLALPIYTKPWGIHSRVLSWPKAGLHGPSYVVLSQPWRTFRRRKHLGTLDFADRIRMVQAAVATPSLLPELRDTV